MGCLLLKYHQNLDTEGLRETNFSHLRVHEKEDFVLKNSYSSYSYGFNGMEKDDEVKGSGNSYTTPFRMLDPRLGRWLSLDPVNHHNMSPYNSFDNNPIFVSDPSGADGRGKLVNGKWEIEATVFFQFDPEIFEGMTEEETANWKADYMKEFQSNIKATWDIQTYKGNPVSTDNVQYMEAPGDMQANDLDKYQNLLQVGKDSYAKANGVSDYMRSNQMSHINSEGGKNNTGYMFSDQNASEAAHEFGHILGLSDRYVEGVGATLDDKWKTGGRATFPLLLDSDPDPSFRQNLMSSGGDHLSVKQLRIAMNRKMNEKDYQGGTIMLPQLDRDGNGTFGYDALYKYGSKFKPLLGTGDATVPTYFYRSGSHNTMLLKKHGNINFDYNTNDIKTTSDELGY